MKIKGKEVKSIVLRDKNDDDVLYIGSEEIINDTKYSVHVNYEESSKTEPFLSNVKECMKECYPSCKGEYVDFDTFMQSVLLLTVKNSK